MIELKLKDLRYLVAVADSGHFGQAAARCFVSQPTLSAQLRKLEDTLGVQLIERRPRRTCLTPAGEQIAERARSMLADADSIVAMAHAQRDPLAGPLRVALLPTIGPYLLPTVASRLRRTLPRLELMLYEYQTDPMLERVRNGDIDLGILALPVPADGCCTRELYEEPFVLAVPQSHALAKRAQVRMDDLKSQPLLLLEEPQERLLGLLLTLEELTVQVRGLLGQALQGEEVLLDRLEGEGQAVLSWGARHH